MNPDLWYLKLIAYASLIWQVLRGVLWTIRYFRTVKKEVTEITAESTDEPLRLFSGFMVSLAIALGALFLLIVSTIQTSPKPLFLTIFAAAVATLILVGTLIQVIVIPGHQFLVQVKKDHVALQEEHKTLRKDHEKLLNDHDRLEKKSELVELQNQYLNARVEYFEAQLRTVLSELQLPLQRKFTFPENPSSSETQDEYTS